MSRMFTNELTWYDEPEEVIRRNGGFSGCDIDIVVRLPGTYDRRGNVISSPVVYQLGSIQTLSYQSYNSKEAVRSLGFKNVKGYARGSRTIAGTLMFNQLYTHVLDDVGNATIVTDSKGILTYSSGDIRYVRNTPIDPRIQEVVGENYGGIQTPIVSFPRHNFDFSWDQNTIGRQLKSSDLPPFDIIAIFVNEYGHVGKMIIYGVELVTEGGVLSIEDVYTEVSMQYVARDIEYFHSESGGGASDNWRGVSPFATGQNARNEFSELYSAAAGRVDAALTASQVSANNEEIREIALRRGLITEEFAMTIEAALAGGVNQTTAIVEDPELDDFVMEVAMDSVRRQNPDLTVESGVADRSVERAMNELKVSLTPNLVETPEGQVWIKETVDDLLSGVVTASALRDRLQREADAYIIFQFANPPGMPIETPNDLMDAALIDFIINYLDE